MNLNITEDDVWLLLASAFRYALGRRTYITSTIAEIILANKEHLTDWQRKLLIKEVEEYKRTYGNIGDDCDEETWLRFADELKKDADK